MQRAVPSPVLFPACGAQREERDGGLRRNRGRDARRLQISIRQRLGAQSFDADIDSCNVRKMGTLVRGPHGHAAMVRSTAHEWIPHAVAGHLIRDEPADGSECLPRSVLRKDTDRRLRS